MDTGQQEQILADAINVYRATVESVLTAVRDDLAANSVLITQLKAQIAGLRTERDAVKIYLADAQAELDRKVVQVATIAQERDDANSKLQGAGVGVGVVTP